jgi:hypothetical protein
MVGLVILNKVGNMKILSSILIVISLTIIFVCSNEQAVVVDKSTQDQKLSDDNVFKGYETALDKAKAVEQTIQNAADLRQKEMEERGY